MPREGVGEHRPEEEYCHTSNPDNAASVATRQADMERRRAKSKAKRARMAEEAAARATANQQHIVKLEQQIAMLRQRQPPVEDSVDHTGVEVLNPNSPATWKHGSPEPKLNGHTVLNPDSRVTRNHGGRELKLKRHTEVWQSLTPIHEPH